MLIKTLLFIVLLSFKSLSAADAPPANEIFAVINERLSYMEDIALFKTYEHLPVEDLQREQKLLDNMQTIAVQQGLDPKSIKQFFMVQIAVAKAIQHRYRADWQTDRPSRKPLGLQAKIRPALIHLGEQMIKQMAKYCNVYGGFNSGQSNTFENAITVKYVTESEKRILFNALLKVRMAVPD